MKKIVSGILTGAFVLGMSASAFAATFTDVPETHWANLAIETMAAKGIVNGTGNNQFSPADNVTGAEFIAMITRSFYGEKVLSEATANGGSYWYTPYIEVGTDLKLLDGVTAGNSPMNRADMAVVIYNFLVEKGVTLPSSEELTKISIPDISNLTAEQQKKITTVYALGYLKGVDEAGNFKGKDNMNRAEAATVMTRLMESYPTEVKVTADQIETARKNVSGNSSSNTNTAKPTADAGKPGMGNSENTVPVDIKDITIPTGKEFQPSLSDKGLKASSDSKDINVNDNWLFGAYTESMRYVNFGAATGTMEVVYYPNNEGYDENNNRLILIEINAKVGDTFTFNCEDFGIKHTENGRWSPYMYDWAEVNGNKVTINCLDDGEWAYYFGYDISGAVIDIKLYK